MKNFIIVLLSVVLVAGNASAQKNSTRSPSFSTKSPSFSTRSPSFSTKSPSFSTRSPSFSQPSKSTGSSSAKPSGSSSWNTSKRSEPSTSWSSPSKSKPSESGKTSWSSPSKPKPSSGSVKPTGSTFDAAAGKDKLQDESQKKWEREQKPSPRPSSEYISAGKKINIDPQSQTTRDVRSITPEQYSNRHVIIEKHYHNYPRYDYYRSQPTVVIGGGYSSIFWYSMMDWELRRQALWYAHNEQRFMNGELNRELWEQRMQNAELRTEIARVKAETGFRPDPSYVDPDFRESRLAMYDPNFIEAAYNPEPTDFPFGTFLGILAIIGLVVAAVYLVFFKNWN